MTHSLPQTKVNQTLDPLIVKQDIWATVGSDRAACTMSRRREDSMSGLQGIQTSVLITCTDIGTPATAVLTERERLRGAYILFLVAREKTLAPVQREFLISL